jgi:hypothetical protein
MTISFVIMYVCPSVCRNGWIRLPKDGYLWNFISGIFPKNICRYIRRFKKIRTQCAHNSRDTYVNFHNITPFTATSSCLKYGKNIRKTSWNVNPLLRQTGEKIYIANIATVKHECVSEMWWNRADCVVWQVKWRISNITNCQCLSWHLPRM